MGVILVLGLAVHQGILLIEAALEKRPARGRLNVCLVLRAVLDRAPMIVIITLSALASLISLSVGTSTKTMFGAIALTTAVGTIAARLWVRLIVPAMLGLERRRKRQTRLAVQNRS